MSSILNRPMFRIPGRSNQPNGIMASSPNLMNASFVSSANASPLLGNLYEKPPAGINPNFEIPVSLYGNQIPPKPDRKAGIDTTEIDKKTLVQQKNESILEKFKREAEKKENIKAGALLVDDPNPVTGKIKSMSNDVVEDDYEDYFGADTYDASISNEGTDKAGTEDNRLENNVNMLSGFKTKQNNLTDQVQTALTKVSAGLADANDIQVGGKTLNQNVDSLVAKMREKGVEPTLADVQDDAIKLLGFDPKELEGEFEEDRKASIFLNMMKAGLAIAAGESPNAITNIAKGFGVGLQGYGEDVKGLTKDLREDRREARNTMYNLLKDAKSQDLAKRTLELQKMEGIVNINRQLVGDKKTEATNLFNQKMTEIKWNQSVLSAAADLGFKEKQLQVTKENIDKTYRLGLAKAEPDVIKMLKLKGEITLKDPSKPEIPFGQPGHVEQYIRTPKADKFIDQYLTELVSSTNKGSLNLSEYNQIRKEITSSGMIPNSFMKEPQGYADLDPSIKRSFGVQGQALKELLEKNSGNPTQQFEDTITFIRRFKDKIPNLAMSLDELPSEVVTFLTQRKQGKALFDKLQSEGILGL